MSTATLELACPDWCTEEHGPEGGWNAQGDDGWTRLHRCEVGMWRIVMCENVAEDGARAYSELDGRQQPSLALGLEDFAVDEIDEMVADAIRARDMVRGWLR